MSSQLFKKIGLKYIGHKLSQSQHVGMRKFKAHFKVSTYICSIVWRKIIINGAPEGSQPKHLLWCLCFLKLYTTDHNRAAFLKADEETVRKWTWIFVSLVANLELVLKNKLYYNNLYAQW